ncbi:MAG: sigma-70 family RNA polymerase sigma factor [Actinobacteria bacterium]|nr:sigma-70 family RNA polymerase sigma factor [Actinomycetota bacterium]
MPKVEHRDPRIPTPVRFEETPVRFEEFYRKEYSRVVAVMYGLTGSWWVAEDLAQDTFVKANQNWTRVSTMDSPSGWVTRVAVNLAMSRFRRLRSEAVALRRFGRPALDVGSVDSRDEAFWNEVRRLPRRQSQVIALLYIDDLTVAEISTILQVAEGTVKSSLHQGRTRLARQLRAKGWSFDES